MHEADGATPSAACGTHAVSIFHSIIPDKNVACAFANGIFGVI